MKGYNYMDNSLLPPEVKVTPDINLKIRIRVLSSVLFELTSVCGANCTKSIEKGVLREQIIDRITISFVDKEGIIRGEVCFVINWDKLEFSAKTNSDITLLKSVSFDRLVAPQLDPELYAVLKQHIVSLKQKHCIKSIDTYFHYRDKYTKNKKTYDEKLAYLGHTHEYEPRKRDIKSLNYELQVAFNGLDGSLDVLLRT